MVPICRSLTLSDELFAFRNTGHLQVNTSLKDVTCWSATPQPRCESRSLDCESGALTTRPITPHFKSALWYLLKTGELFYVLSFNCIRNNRHFFNRTLCLRFRSMFSASESGRSNDSISEEFGDPGAELAASYTGQSVERLAWSVHFMPKIYKYIILMSS